MSNKEIESKLAKISRQATNWIGTPQSIIAHTIFFIGIFGLQFLGFSLDSIMLILTTAVSLEAIYLAIFIQMTVNRNTESLEEVEEDIEEMQEDVEEISEEVEDISEDVDDLTEDIEKIQEDDKTDDQYDAQTRTTLDQIHNRLQQLMNDIEALKEQTQEQHDRRV